MSVGEADSSSVPGGPATASPRKRWRLLLLVVSAVLGLVVATLVVLAVEAAHYQPLGYGSTGNGFEAFPGLPTGKGIHVVNTFGYLHEDYYIPPQAGVFSLFVDVANTGSRAVTIVAVELHPAGQSSWPLRLAGAVRYSRPGMGGSTELPPPTSRILHDVVLGPGQEIFIGIPVRTYTCAQKGGWVAVPSFYVTERFLFFTRTVAIPWGMKADQLVMQAPGGRPGQPDVFCAK